MSRKRGVTVHEGDIVAENEGKPDNERNRLIDHEKEPGEKSESACDTATQTLNDTLQTDPRLTQRRETPLERARRYGASPALGLGIYDDPEDAKEKKSEKAQKAPKKPLTPKAILGKALLLVVCIALVVIVFLPALAGVLNVNVISSDGTMEDAQVQVAVYKGDVVAALVDNDPANDPSALETKDVVVGQRAVFNMKEFGTYTVAVTPREDIPNWSDPLPITVTMMGLDSRITIDVNE